MIYLIIYFDHNGKSFDLHIIINYKRSKKILERKNKKNISNNRPEKFTLEDYKSDIQNYQKLKLGIAGAESYMNSLDDKQLDSGINEIYNVCADSLINDCFILNTCDEAQGFVYCCISEKFLDKIIEDPTAKSATDDIDVGISVRGYKKRTEEKIEQMEKKAKSKVHVLGLKMVDLVDKEKMAYPEILPYTPRLDLILKERKIKSLSLINQAKSFVDPNNTIILNDKLADEIRYY